MRQVWKMYFEDSGVSKHELGGMREYGIRDKNILGCAECAYFNQEMWDEFDIERWDAGCGIKKLPVRPTK